jgi:hypothetical protein
MNDKGELLDLASRCRSLSALCDDDATVRSLDRLADEFETQARVIDYLADCSTSPGERERAVDMPIPLAHAPMAIVPGPAHLPALVSHQ